jgi:hypothetical protein
MAKYKLEYIWLDGYEPVANLRSKTTIKDFNEFPKLEELPVWGFDGSSTRQAEGSSSDCLLKPVAHFPDSTRNNGVLVMCEVLLPDGSPHPSNSRAKDRKTSDTIRAPSGSTQATSPGRNSPPHNATAAIGEKFGNSGNQIARRTRNPAISKIIAPTKTANRGENVDNEVDRSEECIPIDLLPSAPFLQEVIVIFETIHSSDSSGEAVAVRYDPPHVER